MRQLNKEEREICNKQIERMTKQIIDLNEVKEYAKRKMKKLQSDWEFEDFAKPLERKNTKEQNDKVITQAENDIKELKDKIKQLETQLKDGVTLPTGV